MKISVDSARSACARCAAFAGKWLLTVFVAVAAFALAAQALALVLAALALLVIALCLASMCMPEESRAVWAWMRDTLGRWSAVAGTDKADAAQSPDNSAQSEPARDEPARNAPAQSAGASRQCPQGSDPQREDAPK
ncbi:MAG: hypothetical protein QM665_10420 [Desulfovibrio sp.]